MPKSLTDIRNLILGTGAFFRKYRDEIASYFDFYFANYCLKSIKKNNLDISLIFLNGFAHVQHHYLLTQSFMMEKS